MSEMKKILPVIQFYQDVGDTLSEFNENGFKRWTIAKPLGITLFWRIKAALAVLKGDAFACHWQ